MLTNKEMKERVLAEKRLYKQDCKAKKLPYHEEDFTNKIKMTPETLKKFGTSKGFPKLETLEPIVTNLGYDWNTFLNVPYEEQVAKTQAIADVSKVTGLSEKAIEKMKEWTSSDDRRSKWIAYISLLIENDDDTIFNYISEVIAWNKIERMAFYKSDAEGAVDAIDMETAYIHRAGRAFENWLDQLALMSRQGEL